MDARMLKAAIAAGLALTLLIPTFNALNNSYVHDIPPPPWMPTPDDLPDDFEPPEDFEPPPDFKPPPGWEEKYKGKMPPCPPPVERRLNQTSDTIGGNGIVPQSWTETYEIPVPNATLAMGGWINFTNWRASSLRVQILDPDGASVWDKSTNGNSLPTGTNADWRLTYNSYEEKNGQAPAPGPYTLRLSAEGATQGSVTTLFTLALACGGLAS